MSGLSQYIYFWRTLRVSIFQSRLKGGIPKGDILSLDSSKLEPHFALFGSHLPFRHSGNSHFKSSPCLVEGNPAGWIVYTSALRLFSLPVLSAAFLEKQTNILRVGKRLSLLGNCQVHGKQRHICRSGLFKQP